MDQTPVIRLDTIAKPGQVVVPEMAKIYRIELEERDLGQLLDGLEVRAEAWERTAVYLKAESNVQGSNVQSRVGELFVVEECSKPEEAEDIAAHYRVIIQKIRQQMEEQT